MTVRPGKKIPQVRAIWWRLCTAHMDNCLVCIRSVDLCGETSVLALHVGCSIRVDRGIRIIV